MLYLKFTDMAIKLRKKKEIRVTQLVRVLNMNLGLPMPSAILIIIFADIFIEKWGRSKGIKGKFKVIYLQLWSSSLNTYLSLVLNLLYSFNKFI